MSERETLQVKARLFTYANYRTGHGLGSVLADIIDPLPPRHLWTFEDQHRNDYAGRPQFYRTRSGKKPAALAHIADGDVFTMSALIDRWADGLGGLMASARVVEDPS